MTGAPSALGGRPGQPANLDGTYTGTVNYPDGGLTGDGTLTITGNTFTLNGQSGTLTAYEWPGYIAVSMRFGTDTPAKIVSVRAKRSGSWLTLTSVAGEAHQFSFRGTSGATGGTTTGGRRRRHGRRQGLAPPPPTAASTEPTTTEPTATPTTGRRRRGRRRGTNTNMNSNMGNNTNNSNTP